MEITGFILCDKGCEDLASFEISQRLNNAKKVTTANRCCTVKTTFNDFAQFTYLSQSAVRSMALLAEAKTPEELGEKLTTDILTQWFPKESTFKVDAISVIKQQSQELAKHFGAHITKLCDTKANMTNPDIQLLVIQTENTIYAGVDMTQTNLAKREYKIFTNPATLRATISFNALLDADYNPELTLLDPCTGSGTIPIEAALFALNKSPRFFEKEKLAFNKLKQFTAELVDEHTDERLPVNGFDITAKAVDMSKKNAKIADVVQSIRFARCDADWLDTKFEEDSVDCIVTCPPYFSKHVPDTKIEKVFTDLFERGKLFLTKSAKLLFITNNAPKVEALIQKPYKHIATRHVLMGKEDLWFVKIKFK